MKTILCATAAALLCLSSAAFAQTGAERHVAKGIPCTACHGAKQEIAAPNIDQCTKCHNPASVAKKTANVKPRNPHQSPHYGNQLDCVLCHVQHEATENYCDQCHKFGFKVP